MIYVSEALRPELRFRPFSQITDLPCQEERERFYIITSFNCPNACRFCLFRMEAIRDCSNARMADRISQILQAFPLDFSISITGGEPLWDAARTIEILNAITAHTTPGKVRWIGFGTSGVSMPSYLDRYRDWRFDLYLSRHHYLPEKQASTLGTTLRLFDPGDYRQLGPHVSVRLTCNLIRGEIDDLDDIKRYLNYANSHGVRHVTFRELNRVSDEASMYAHVKRYVDYYHQRLVPLQEICERVERDSAFRFLSQDIRPFIYHERWQYGDIEVLFRRVDEEQLLAYNAGFADVDEIVLHPDGLVTGCWDRHQKVLEFES